MRAMILAAGRGERMRPLTDHTPKPLLKVGGKSLIAWHLERLARAGFQHIVINHAHLGSQIEAALGDGSTWGVNITYSPEPVALETAGGIANALPYLGSEAFLVVNGDVFTDIDFRSLTSVLHPPVLAHLVLVNNPPQHPQGDFGLNGGYVTAEGHQKYTFSGVGVYHPSLFSGIERGTACKLAPLLMGAMQESFVTGQLHAGEWHDIGTAERLNALDAKLKVSIILE